MKFRNQYTPSPPELRQNANNRTMWFAQYGRDGTFTVKTKRRRREPMTDGPRAVQKRILNGGLLPAVPLSCDPRTHQTWLLHGERPVRCMWLIFATARCIPNPTLPVRNLF